MKKVLLKTIPIAWAQAISLTWLILLMLVAFLFADAFKPQIIEFCKPDYGLRFILITMVYASFACWPWFRIFPSHRQ